MLSVALVVPFDPYNPLNPSNASMPPLRLACLAATTRALGHRATVIDGVGLGYGQRWSLDERFHLHGLRIPELVQRVPEDVDVVGISMMFTQTWPAVRALIEALRRARPGAHLCIGGEGVTGIAEAILRESQVDSIAVGEGEPPWTALLAALEAGEPPAATNLVTRQHPPGSVIKVRARTALKHLDQLPDPDWSDIPLPAYWAEQRGHSATDHGPMLPIVASRGCAWACQFCTAPTTWGRQRYRSPAAVVAEMKRQHERHGIRFFSFNDLSITTNHRWFSQFLDVLLEARLPIHWGVPAGIRAERLSVDVLRRARDSGLTYLQIAPETGSLRVLEWLDKRFALDSVLETVRNARTVGIPIGAYIIVGHPVEEPEDFLATLRFLTRLASEGVNEIAVSHFTALPGSPFFEKLKARGEIVFDDDFYYTLSQGDFGLRISHTPHFDGDEVQAMRLQALLWFYAQAFGRHPRRLAAMASRLLRGGQQTKLDRVLRYESKALLAAFAPVVAKPSLALAGRLLRARLRAARAPEAQPELRPRCP